MGDVTWFGLEEEQKIAVFLCLFVIWEEAFLDFSAILQMAGHFFALS
jgi:hypothetical protein